MSSHIRRIRRNEKRRLAEYANMLAATGMDEREVARAYFYAHQYGLNALSQGDDCVTFGTPTCGDDNCINPEHQVLEVTA